MKLSRSVKDLLLIGFHKHCVTKFLETHNIDLKEENVLKDIDQISYSIDSF